MRKRMIDPEIFDSADSKGWTPDDFTVMVAAICSADDEGRGRITMVKKNIISMISEKRFQKSLRKLNDSIVIYQKIYFFLPKFKNYQWLSKPKPSKFPEPNLIEAKDLGSNLSDNIPIIGQESDCLIELNRIELNRNRIEGESLPLPFTNPLSSEMQILWATTWGRNPKIPEHEETEKLIEKFGIEKVKQIFKSGSLKNFKNFDNFLNSLDENGNIKPLGTNNGTNQQDSKGTVKSRLDYKPDLSKIDSRIEELKIITGESKRD